MNAVVGTDAAPQTPAPVIAEIPPDRSLKAGVHGTSVWRERVDHWTKIIGATLGLIGLFLTWAQLRENGEALNSQTIEQIYSRMHDIDKMFVEHPEWKPYFYEGMQVTDDNPLIQTLGLKKELVQAQIPSLAELMCDFFAQALLQLKNLPKPAYDGWQNYIKEVYKQSPAMRTYYHDNERWYQYEEAARLFKAADKDMVEAAKAKASAPTPKP